MATVPLLFTVLALVSKVYAGQDPDGHKCFSFEQLCNPNKFDSSRFRNDHCHSECIVDGFPAGKCDDKIQKCCCTEKETQSHSSHAEKSSFYEKTKGYSSPTQSHSDQSSLHGKTHGYPASLETDQNINNRNMKTPSRQSSVSSDTSSYSSGRATPDSDSQHSPLLQHHSTTFGAPSRQSSLSSDSSRSSPSGISNGKKVENEESVYYPGGGITSPSRKSSISISDPKDDAYSVHSGGLGRSANQARLETLDPDSHSGASHNWRTSGIPSSQASSSYGSIPGAFPSDSSSIHSANSDYTTRQRTPSMHSSLSSDKDGNSEGNLFGMNSAPMSSSNKYGQKEASVYHQRGGNTSPSRQSSISSSDPKDDAYSVHSGGLGRSANRARLETLDPDSHSGASHNWRTSGTPSSQASSSYGSIPRAFPSDSSSIHSANSDYTTRQRTPSMHSSLSSDKDGNSWENNNGWNSPTANRASHRTPNLDSQSGTRHNWRNSGTPSSQASSSGGSIPGSFPSDSSSIHSTNSDYATRQRTPSMYSSLSSDKDGNSEGNLFGMNSAPMSSSNKYGQKEASVYHQRGGNASPSRQSSISSRDPSDDAHGLYSVGLGRHVTASGTPFRQSSISSDKDGNSQGNNNGWNSPTANRASHRTSNLDSQSGSRHNLRNSGTSSSQASLSDDSMSGAFPSDSSSIHTTSSDYSTGQRTPSRYSSVSSNSLGGEKHDNSFTGQRASFTSNSKDTPSSGRKEKKGKQRNRQKNTLQVLEESSTSPGWLCERGQHFCKSTDVNQSDEEQLPLKYKDCNRKCKRNRYVSGKCEDFECCCSRTSNAGDKHETNYWRHHHKPGK